MLDSKELNRIFMGFFAKLVGEVTKYLPVDSIHTSRQPLFISQSRKANKSAVDGGEGFGEVLRNAVFVRCGNCGNNHFLVYVHAATNRVNNLHADYPLK